MGVCAALLIIYLLAERIILSRRSRSIPLRICVTGTRGKSSVTRLIAASLREAGFTVLAKATGSNPVAIFPDGGEKEIVRKGPPSILEGKKILKTGAKLHVRALVSELMSIHPERSYVESIQMFKPHILVITNVRPDHLAQMGSSREDIARCFARSIPKNCTVFVPQEEIFPVFEERSEKMDSKLIQVPRCSPAESYHLERKPPFFEFGENIRLSLAVADFLGIDRKVSLRGIANMKPDFGSLKIWTADLGSPSHRWYLVSIFAANDPESTRCVLSRLQEKRLLERKNTIGLLNLRKDRGDRTIQWLEALKKGDFHDFHKLLFIGDHIHALKRRLKLSSDTALYFFKKQSLEIIMEKLTAAVEGETVLVGMGNMGGFGKILVEYWERIGKPHDL